jgi:hypothetical protein
VTGRLVGHPTVAVDLLLDPALEEDVAALALLVRRQMGPDLGGKDGVIGQRTILCAHGVRHQQKRDHDHPHARLSHVASIGPDGDETAAPECLGLRSLYE